MYMGKFVIKPVKTGFVFRLAAGNGETIGAGEVYTTFSACKNGVESVRKNAEIAALEDQTAGGEAKCPKFELYTDKAEEFRFRLKAGNGEIILSSEGYKSKSGCENGVASVRRNAPHAELIIEE